MTEERRTHERRVGRVTTKGRAEERMRSADEGLLQRQEDPGFVHTDPWRVLRIMGEFVDGFDALARRRPGGDGLRLGAHQGRLALLRGRARGRRAASPGAASR